MERLPSKARETQDLRAGWNDAQDEVGAYSKWKVVPLYLPTEFRTVGRSRNIAFERRFAPLDADDAHFLLAKSGVVWLASRQAPEVPRRDERRVINIA